MASCILKEVICCSNSKLQSILDVPYTCGASLEDLDLPESLQGVVIRDHCCEDTIEQLYYSAGYENICIFCAATCDLVENLPSSVCPLCTSCNSNMTLFRKGRQIFFF